MRKILYCGITMHCLVSSYYVSATSSSVANNLAGEYACTGYDRLDKALRCKLTITLDMKNSLLRQGYSAYNIKMLAPSDMVVEGLPPNIAATGSIASNGNTFAMSFKNTNPKAPTDYGTAIGMATYDQDKNGIGHTVLHFFSYQAAYKGGDNSIWTCLKN